MSQGAVQLACQGAVLHHNAKISSRYLTQYAFSS
jgi:hypothetical protein